MVFDKYLKVVYSLWAKCYDTFVDPLFKFDRKSVIKQLRSKKNDHILELGVGTGLNLPFYPAFCRITGVDFSSAMLKKAKQKRTLAKLSLLVADARSLPFAANSFDKAITTYVLRVSPDPKKILREVSRVVKKGGLFIIVDQFKGENKFLLAVFQPFKLLLGWGREYVLDELLKGSAWGVITNNQFGVMKNTRLVVLKNEK